MRWPLRAPRWLAAVGGAAASGGPTRPSFLERVPPRRRRAAQGLGRPPDTPSDAPGRGWRRPGLRDNRWETNRARVIVARRKWDAPSLPGLGRAVSRAGLGPVSPGAVPAAHPVCPRIVSTGGSRGRPGPCPQQLRSGRGRRFPSDPAARAGGRGSGRLPQPVGGGLPRSSPRALWPPEPPWLPWGYLFQRVPPRPPRATCPAHSGCTPRLARWEETLRPTVGPGLDRLGGGRPGIAGHRIPPIHPQGHGWLPPGQWPPQPGSATWSLGPGGWARAGTWGAGPGV